LAVRLAMDVPLPALLAAVEGLCGINFVLLGCLRGQVPRLYESGIVYREPGKKQWFNVADLYDEGFGDCKDLVACRVAELRYFDAELAMPHVYLTRRERRYHAVVKRADGSIEDPSAIVLEVERERGGAFR
jgi:hypothetical protein